MTYSHTNYYHYETIETTVTSLFDDDNRFLGCNESKLYPNELVTTEIYDSDHKLVGITQGMYGAQQTIDEDTLTIAVLGDLHGHVNLALSLLVEWKKQTKRDIDGILQVGDFGVFPDPGAIDKATKKFAANDPEEMGFLDYVMRSEHGDMHFGPEGNFSETDIYFIKGNHEDFEYLAQFEQRKTPTPIDMYGHINYVANDQVFSISNDSVTSTIAGLGGLDTHTTKRRRPYHNTAKDYTNLMTRNFDVLLTHEDFMNERSSHGSPRLKELIDIKQPKYHFLGHIKTNQHALLQGRTESYHLDDVTLAHQNQLSPYCAGILSINKDTSSFEYISNHWLKEFSEQYIYQNNSLRQ